MQHAILHGGCTDGADRSDRRLRRGHGRRCWCARTRVSPAVAVNWQQSVNCLATSRARSAAVCSYPAITLPPRQDAGQLRRPGLSIGPVERTSRPSMASSWITTSASRASTTTGTPHGWETGGVVAKAFKSFLDCGILAHGFLRVVCKDCRDEILVPWSCKTCQLCPSSGSRRSEEFAALLHERVLEAVPWRHVVLTIPKALRGLFLRERRLLRELSRCAWKTIRQAFSTALGSREIVPGVIVSVSTSGDLVNPHPHLHCIVSAGAWTGERFAPWPDAITAERLEALFRCHVLKMLVRQQRLEQENAERLLRWGRSGFSVFVGEPIAPHADESLLRLARYLVKPPVSLQRLSYDQTTCTVTYRSQKRAQVRSIAALDFPFVRTATPSSRHATLSCILSNPLSIRYRPGRRWMTAGHREQPEVTDSTAQHDAVDPDPGWPVGSPFPDD